MRVLFSFLFDSICYKNNTSEHQIYFEDTCTKDKSFAKQSFYQIHDMVVTCGLLFQQNVNFISKQSAQKVYKTERDEAGRKCLYYTMMTFFYLNRFIQYYNSDEIKVTMGLTSNK